MTRVTTFSHRMEWIDHAAASRLGDVCCYCSNFGDCRLLGHSEGRNVSRQIGSLKKGVRRVIGCIWLNCLPVVATVDHCSIPSLRQARGTGWSPVRKRNIGPSKTPVNDAIHRSKAYAFA